MIIRATFPRGVFYGTDTPVPHPARLMSAMVASYYGAESQDPAEDEVLKKLEATNAQRYLVRPFISDSAVLTL